MRINEPVFSLRKKAERPRPVNRKSFRRELNLATTRLVLPGQSHPILRSMEPMGMGRDVAQNVQKIRRSTLTESVVAVFGAI